MDMTTIGSSVFQEDVTRNTLKAGEYRIKPLVGAELNELGQFHGKGGCCGEFSTGVGCLQGSAG